MKHIIRWLILIASLIGLAFVGKFACDCNAQQRARNSGGSMTVELPTAQKLEFSTWKDDELWYQTRPMRPDEQPEEHIFHQQKAGILNRNGQVFFKESR